MRRCEDMHIWMCADVSCDDIMLMVLLMCLKEEPFAQALSRKKNTHFIFPASLRILLRQHNNILQVQDRSQANVVAVSPEIISLLMPL